jgi:AraC-like DNA-binding protein
MAGRTIIPKEPTLVQKIRAAGMERHAHAHPYAALVLSGRYEEAGDCGRFHVRAGHVVLHDRFEEHLNRFPAGDVVVLNIPLDDFSFKPGLGTAVDVDGIARVAEKDSVTAATLLLSQIEMKAAPALDWPDELAAELMRNPATDLGIWSETRNIAPWTLSRGFARVFGLPPVEFRTRVRARAAWRAIRKTDKPLAALAAIYGFADQAHMTRSVKRLTGRTPRDWRACK